MPRGHAGLPTATSTILSKSELLEQLSVVDCDNHHRERVLRLESAFRGRINAHLRSLPAIDAVFGKFNTNPYVLLIHAKQKGYSRISEIESDILPAKQFSSMETSAGRMIEEVVLPEYGWTCIPSEMHSPNSALDGKKQEPDLLRLVTLKSGPRCLNDEMSENFAGSILQNYEAWASDAGIASIDFSYGVLYGTKKQSNKKDWHILRNIREKLGGPMTTAPDGRWDCQFHANGITVVVTVRIGLDWWRHLGGEFCFIEVFSALIRACIAPGNPDAAAHRYGIIDLNDIVSTGSIPADYNVSLLQRSQLPWLMLLARHFCDGLRA